jgi:hypothetical protein
MGDFMSHTGVPIAIGAVAVVLWLGLINMMRGGALCCNSPPSSLSSSPSG